MKAFYRCRSLLLCETLWLPLDIIRARVYVKRKREGIKANSKVQNKKQTEDISGNNSKEQVIGVEGSNPEADDNSANNIISSLWEPVRNLKSVQAT